jgi:DNA-binding transcriptional MerR regulator
MGVIRTNAAAAMLGVSPNTLRSWERRFGFPEPRRTTGGHRQFDLGQIEALRAAFEETHNVSSAIAIARERGTGPASDTRLRSAFNRFDEVEAGRILEESLAVRSLERTVEEVLLPAVEQLAQDGEGPEHGFAWRWGATWLAASMRVTPAATRDEGIVIFDASTAYDVEALYVQALELVLRRRGMRTLTISVALDPSRMARALHAVEPRAVVLAGHGADLDALGRLVFGARRIGGDHLLISDFRHALPDSGASTVTRLGDKPVAAADHLLAAIDGREVWPAAPTGLEAVEPLAS